MLNMFVFVSCGKPDDQTLQCFLYKLHIYMCPLYHVYIWCMYICNNLKKKQLFYLWLDWVSFKTLMVEHCLEPQTHISQRLMVGWDWSHCVTYIFGPGLLAFWDLGTESLTLVQWAPLQLQFFKEWVNISPRCKLGHEAPILCLFGVQGF